METGLGRRTLAAEPSDRGARVGGAIFVLVGSFLGYVTAVDPLREAKLHQAPEVVVHPAVALVPAVLLLGMALLIGGARASRWAKKSGIGRRADGKRSPAAWAFGIALSIPGFALYFWLRYKLAELGYGVP